MADPLEQRRDLAMQAVDHFTDTWHGPLYQSIQAENHIPNLQVVINGLNLMLHNLMNPAIFAGGVAVEVMNEEEINEVRAVAVESVTSIRNLVPVIQNYIDEVNNIDNLNNALNRLYSIYQDLIASVLP